MGSDFGEEGRRRLSAKTAWHKISADTLAMMKTATLEIGQTCFYREEPQHTGNFD